MPSEMERKLRAARKRLAADRMLTSLAGSLSAAGLAAAILLVANNFFYPMGFLPDGGLLSGWPAWLGAANLRWATANWLILPAIIAAAICYSAIKLLADKPSIMATAIAVDSRLKLKECFSTAVELTGLNNPKEQTGKSGPADTSPADEPFAQATIKQTLDVAGKLNQRALAEKFPIRFSSRWRLPAAMWTTVILLLFFLPVFDIFGAMSRRESDVRQARADNQTKVEIKQAAQTIQSLVNKLGDENLKNELEELKKLAEGTSKPEDLQTAAIKQMTDIKDKLKEDLKADNKIDAAQTFKNLLKQLKESPGNTKQEIKKALARGQINQASQKLSELLGKLEEGNLTPEQLAALQKELKDISEQLDKIDFEKQAAKELQNSGMSPQEAKQVAGMSDNDIREALKKDGYSDEQIEKMMNKLAALRKACQQCKNLSDSARRACEGKQLSAGELAKMLEQLRQAEGEMEDAELVQMTLEELEAQIARLGKCDDDSEMDGGIAILGGDGQNSSTDHGQQSAVDSAQHGTFAGKGTTKHDAELKGDVEYEKTGVKSQDHTGPVIASTVFHGPQVKGQAKQQFESTVQAAKDGASEAIKDNKIPKKYESSVKKYFGQLEQTEKSGK